MGGGGQLGHNGPGLFILLMAKTCLWRLSACMEEGVWPSGEGTGLKIERLPVQILVHVATFPSLPPHPLPPPSHPLPQPAWSHSRGGKLTV